MERVFFPIFWVPWLPKRKQFHLSKWHYLLFILNQTVHQGLWVLILLTCTTLSSKLGDRVTLILWTNKDWHTSVRYGLQLWLMFSRWWRLEVKGQWNLLLWTTFQCYQRSRPVCSLQDMRCSEIVHPFT